jgi:hypothetical protein
MRRPAVRKATLGLALALAACAAPTRDPGPTRAVDFRPGEIRQPLVALRFLFGGEIPEPERRALRDLYEGLLLEELNARALPARDVRTVEGEAAAVARLALGRAREVGADHAIVVTVRVERDRPLFCAETRRAFRAPATVWRQALEVLRAADGARRLALGESPRLTATDLEADCGDPRRSRRRGRDEATGEAVQRLLGRLLEG